MAGNTYAGYIALMPKGKDFIKASTTAGGTAAGGARDAKNASAKGKTSSAAQSTSVNDKPKLVMNLQLFSEHGKGTSQAEFPSRNTALKQAKKDANILSSKHPDDIKRVEMRDAESRGVHVLKYKDSGKIVEFREYHYMNRFNEKVVIQEHTYKHVGSENCHFNVRPSTNTRTGVFEGTKAHYPFKGTLLE